MMCEWNTTIDMELTIPANLSHTGRDYCRTVAIDACIAPIVRALNDGGVPTVASCCGHGKEPGRIALADGRELVVTTPPDDDRRDHYEPGVRMLETVLTALGAGEAGDASS